MSKPEEAKKITITDRVIEIIIAGFFLMPIILFLYYVSYYSNERITFIINKETSLLNNHNHKPVKEDFYITAQQDIDKRGTLIEKQSATYISDNKKYTLILIEKLIIKFQYSKSSKNNLMETISFLKNHQTENDCKKAIEKTSNYFISKTKSLMYPEYKKVEINNGYLYHYEGFIGMKVPTMEFYCKGTMEIAKINILKENFFKNYTLK